ncbi:MAG: hypothetical protein AAB758_00380 [Patescibacteria group bacterium]
MRKLARIIWAIGALSGVVALYTKSQLATGITLVFLLAAVVVSGFSSKKYHFDGTP